MHIENYSEGVYVCNSYYLFLKKKSTCVFTAFLSLIWNKCSYLKIRVCTSYFEKFITQHDQKCWCTFLVMMAEQIHNTELKTRKLLIGHMLSWMVLVILDPNPSESSQWKKQSSLKRETSTCLQSGSPWIDSWLVSELRSFFIWDLLILGWSYYSTITGGTDNTYPALGKKPTEPCT